ncbi:MAG: zinc-ribbon domain-containing protein [Actinobacteria bacterium]|nr:MAG: zinc-ribbon domain-containing protein [Actinomycetota bacterium]
MAACSSCGASLPPAARFCPSCGASAADEARGEERKVATVLFADLVGSTELAGQQDAERTRARLNRFYDAMAAEIAEAGGTIEKFIGDAVVAAFGAPAAQEDHADRALHAALSMRSKLEELFGDSLKLRIGVNTGDVVVGEPRVGSSFVSGDAVNVAARLEQAAGAGQILVGARTTGAVRSPFEFGDQVVIEAKGKPAGVLGRLLLRALAPPGARADGAPATFVGREAELAALESAYSSVVAGSVPRFVTVVGAAGVGKTTLLQELWPRLAPAPVRRIGRCRSFGRASAYSPLGEIVREHPGALERWPILGVTLGRPAPADLHPLAVAERLRAAWTGMLDELVADRAAVVLVEDLHWADPELVELLDHGATAVRGPLLLLGTARERPEAGEAVELRPLASEDAGRMVDRLAPEHLGGEVRAFVVERAEGNPFFVEELLRMLADRGVKDEIPSGLVVPDTVHALLAARIDLLAPTEKSALQAAAVIGRTFGVEPLRALVEGEAPLAALAARSFVREDGDRHAFVHTLTREVAYGSLTTPARARLHACYADWLESAGGGRDEDAAELAFHFAEAVRPEEADLAWPDDPDEYERLRANAVGWLRQASRLAVGRYEMREAVVLLERAVELEPDRDTRRRLWEEIAHANVLFFDGKAFAAAMEEAIALASGDRALADLYAELAFQTMARAGMWGTAPPSDLVQGWIERALELAAPDTAARAKALIARCYADYDKSADDAAEASTIADRLGDPALRSRGYDVRHLVAFVHGDYRDALEWCRRRESFVHELDDADAATYVYAFAINPAVACGELDEARRYAALHDDATRLLSPHHRLHGAALLLLLEELLANWEKALELQELIETRVEESAATPCVLSARSLYLCALANAHLGNDDEAERLERRAAPLAMTGYGTVLDTPRLLLALHRGDLTAVESLLGEPAVRASNWFYLSSMAAHLDGLAALGERERVEHETALVLQPGTYLEPFALRALGLVREDAVLIGQAAERFDAFGLAWHASQTRALAG